MTRQIYIPLFWVEIGIGAVALAYAVLALIAILPRRPKRVMILGKPLPRRLMPAEEPDGFHDRLSASGKAMIPALGVVIAAVAGILANPYVHDLVATRATAAIEQITGVNGNSCEREVSVRASIPSGDALAIGVVRKGQREEDFQSAV